MTNKYYKELWTSKLIIESKLDNEYVDKIVTEISEEINNKFNKFNKNSLINTQSISVDDLIDFVKTTIDFDSPNVNFKNIFNQLIEENNLTCILKGLFNDKLLYRILNDNEIDTPIFISFGGDILANNWVNYRCQVENSNLFIERSGNFSICTSGNTNKRGNHIKCEYPQSNKLCTVVGNIPCWIADYYSTKIYAKEVKPSDIPYEVYFIDSNDRFKSGRKTYIASPFFNSKEIKIRNKMLDAFSNYFRPDETESSKKFESEHTKELSNSIFEDNINGISNCIQLVFPEHTDDLGTLFEVGHAIYLNKIVIRYDYKTDTYIILDSNNKTLSKVEVNVGDIIDCSKLSGAILLGYNSNKNICYTIGDLKDNIMLSTNFIRYEKDSSGNYVRYLASMEEVR